MNRPGSVGRDVGGAAAVAGGGLSPLDVQVEQLHLLEGKQPVLSCSDQFEPKNAA